MSNSEYQDPLRMELKSYEVRKPFDARLVNRDLRAHRAGPDRIGLRVRSDARKCRVDPVDKLIAQLRTTFFVLQGG